MPEMAAKVTQELQGGRTATTDIFTGYGGWMPVMLEAGALRMFATRAGERIVAVFYGFAFGDTFYYYLSGYDPALEKLSIGTLMVAHAVDEAVREGATTFDFLRGAEEYKYAWGAKDRMNRRRQLVRG